MKFLLIYCVSLIFPAWARSAEPDGKLLFTQNCSVCHALDQTLVGPSLVEIRTIYGENPDGFVEWCTTPGKKRQEAIEMPSMAHLGEVNLLAIHRHILAISAGKSEKQVSEKDPFGGPASGPTYPRVQRIFMPDAGPAAVAVALDGKTSLCWDAGVCRLRYVWSGGFIDGYPYWRGNGSRTATLLGNVRYAEAESPFGNEVPIQFHGYEMVQGLPVFEYSAGGLEISESFKALPEGKGIQRHFKLMTRPATPLKLRFPANDKVSICSSRGTIADGILSLTPEDAMDFTLTLVFR